MDIYFCFSSKWEYHDYLFSDGFLFLLFQASIFEALTQSFQVAFALRSYSLTDAGNIVD
jgi:hypothetical protein